MVTVGHNDNTGDVGEGLRLYFRTEREKSKLRGKAWACLWALAV